MTQAATVRGPHVFHPQPNLHEVFDDSGIELWKSDGTTSGTMKVKRLCVGGDSRADHLTSVDGTLFFTADDGASGQELWKSDGTASGTVMAKDTRTSHGL